MADTKISELTAVTNPTSSDVLPIVSGAETKKVTVANLTAAEAAARAAADALLQPLDADLTAIAALSPSNDDVIQRKAGAWANRTIAQLKTDLSLSGTNTGDQDLGALQPLDGDLSAIAALSPSNDDVIQRKAGAWTNRTPAQVKTDLVLVKGDVGLGNVDNTADSAKPVSTATQTALDLKVDENAAITGATKTKITYDAKGLVTSGADATTADIADSSNKRYVTDADLVDIGNLSGVNTGDQVLTSVLASSISDGDTTHAPDGNSVFDALALKLNANSVPVTIGIACSDESTALTTGTAKVTFRMPHAMTLTAVRSSINTVSSSGLVTVGINEGGSTILSTDLSIDQGEKTSTTAATPAVISDSALADDAEITIDIDAAGTGAKGLKVWLIGTRAV